MGDLDSQILALLQDLKGELATVKGGLENVTAEQIRMAERIAANEVTWQKVAQANMADRDGLAQREAEIAARLDRNAEMTETAQREALLNAPTVRVRWRGESPVIVNGAVVGPYTEGAEVDVPNWVPGVWAEQDKMLAEGARFQEQLKRVRQIGEMT